MANKPESWTQADRVELRNFIAKNPRFMRELTRRRPTIEGETMEHRAVTGSDVKGFFDAIEAIEKMQEDPPTSEQPGFIPS